MGKTIAKSLLLATTILIQFYNTVCAASLPVAKTPEEFAKQYMAAFNKKDNVLLKKLRYPSSVKSEMQEMIDEITEAEMKDGTRYNTFSIEKIKPEMLKSDMGPDGQFYKPNLTPTNTIKFTAKTANSTTSTTIAIGQKNGIFYQVCPVPDKANAPSFQFGWQKFIPPGVTTWSVMMPNEPEPGRAALEKQSGKDALKDPDIYGVVKNTASIKTTMHMFSCGAEGKREDDESNPEIYRLSCTTYDPETLKEFFSDYKKTLGESVGSRMRFMEGKLISKKELVQKNVPALEYEIEGKSGSYCVGRSYWLNNSLIELSVVAKKNKPSVQNTERYFNSLESN